MVVGNGSQVSEVPSPEARKRPSRWMGWNDEDSVRPTLECAQKATGLGWLQAGNLGLEPTMCKKKQIVSRDYDRISIAIS